MKNLFIASVFLSFFLVTACKDSKHEHKEAELAKLPTDGIAEYYDASLKPFYHGVASGDPLSDRVIIWTRVTPEDSLKSIQVVWEVAADSSFNRLINQGNAEALPENDYTVKVDVDKLSPDQRYYYRFTALGSTSVTGLTRTSPAGSSDSLKFAILSCSNYEFGYFNTYKALAKRDDIHAVLHLGDYIYEYPVGTYGDTTIGRKHYPSHEIISLEDYRLRYSQYRLDPDLRAAHKSHPFITIWDDHEIANNSYVDGAQNHQAEEGDYKERREAARKAYYEWLPVRQSDQLYRHFNYGGLAELIMLDERLAGRTAPVDSLTDPVLQDTARTMLGKQQMSWFQSRLSDTQSQWKIIGNQVIYSYLNWGRPDFNINLDSWDGYPAEQKKISRYIRDNKIENVIFVTGDTHASWAFEVTVDPFNDYNRKTGKGSFAVEFGTTSVNSGNANEMYPNDTVLMHEQYIVNSPLNPHLKYANLRDHGYLLLSVYSDHAQAQFYYVETLRERNANVVPGASFSVQKGSTRLISE